MLYVCLNGYTASTYYRKPMFSSWKNSWQHFISMFLSFVISFLYFFLNAQIIYLVSDRLSKSQKKLFQHVLYDALAYSRYVFNLSKSLYNSPCHQGAMRIRQINSQIPTLSLSKMAVIYTSDHTSVSLVVSCDLAFKIPQFKI